MVFSILTQLFALLMDCFATIGMSNSDKDLEILLLRWQVRILQRKTKSQPKISRPERLVLDALAVRLKRTADDSQKRLHDIMLLFKPETVLRWHRDLVRRKWAFRSKKRIGRPRLSSEIEALIVRLAQENARWGYDKIQGEVLKRNRILPATGRSSSSWRSFLGHYKDQMLACDFFTIETTFKTIYVLFFIELGTRRVHLVAGCTAHPNDLWVTQQARQLVWELEDRSQPNRYLIHDRDTKFTTSFDTVFVSEGTDMALNKHCCHEVP